MQVVPKYGASAFQLDKTITDKNGRRMNFERFRFYLSNIKLVKTDNTIVPLKSVVYLDMEKNPALTFDVDATNGDFKELQFSIGIDSIQNLTDPTSVAESDPLNANKDMWWGTTQKYVFSRLEGSADTAVGGTGNLNWKLLYHIGQNENYRTVKLSKAISILADKQTTLVLNFDLEKVFFGTSTVDIKTEPVTHSNDNIVLATKYADNFSQAFTLE
jgi:hypothetical protein